LQVTAKVSKTLLDKTIGSGTLSTSYGQGGQTVTLIDDDGKTVGQVPMANHASYCDVTAAKLSAAPKSSCATAVTSACWCNDSASRHQLICVHSCR
jgi:hypothetical protein